jgi:hypothetical protein
VGEDAVADNEREALLELHRVRLGALEGGGRASGAPRGLRDTEAVAGLELLVLNPPPQVGKVWLGVTSRAFKMAWLPRLSPMEIFTKSLVEGGP